MTLKWVRGVDAMAQQDEDWYDMKEVGWQGHAACLYEVHASLVGGCSKTAHVSNDAATQCNKGAVPVQPALQCLVPHLLQYL